jgi:hypothetical protein
MADLRCAGCDRLIRQGQPVVRVLGDPCHDNPRCIREAQEDDGT